MYGEIFVPQGYTEELPSNYNYARESVPNIYRMLITDLRYAYDHLPDVNEQNLTTDFGRATKGAAAHFWQNSICNVHKVLNMVVRNMV